jgi:hypothetical protein
MRFILAGTEDAVFFGDFGVGFSMVSDARLLIDLFCYARRDGIVSM